MTKEELKNLKEEIEIKMYELRRLQQEHRSVTGKNFTPPVRMDTPIWARKGGNNG